MMIKQDTDKMKDQTILEDLPVDNAQPDEVKGRQAGSANGWVWKTSNGGLQW